MSGITAINTAICEALGLDPTRVSELRIELAGSRVPVVVARMLVPVDGRLTSVLRRFELVEKPAVPAA
jgi:hypothetical protein